MKSLTSGIATIVLGAAVGCLGAVVFKTFVVSARTPADKTEPAILRDPHAGVYETSTGSPNALAGGVGLFPSGRYAFALAEHGTKSGMWTLEGNTIRLKDPTAGDTLLRILEAGQLACEHDGARVVFKLKSADDPSPSIFRTERQAELGKRTPKKVQGSGEVAAD